jgi:hypothetical protein
LRMCSRSSGSFDVSFLLLFFFFGLSSAAGILADRCKLCDPRSLNRKEINV